MLLYHQKIVVRLSSVQILYKDLSVGYKELDAKAIIAEKFIDASNALRTGDAPGLVMETLVKELGDAQSRAQKLAQSKEAGKDRSLF